MVFAMGRGTARSHEPEQVARDSDQTPASPTDDARNRKPSSVRDVRFATASHLDLFAEASERRCDVCGDALDPAESEEHGTGVYIWARGDEVRRDEAPLCASCSSGIIASAYGFFDGDDEE